MKVVFEQFVEQTAKAVSGDRRFVGLAVSGSWVRDEVDDFSDLDLLIVCDGDSTPDPAEMRQFAASLGSLISSFSGEHVGEPNLLICLFDAETVIHVDLKFETSSDLEKRPYDSVVMWERESAISSVYAESTATPVAPDAQWIEDRFWTWIHYAGLRLGRSEVFELVSFLGFVRDTVLGPLALHAAGFPPHGVRKIERYLPEFARRLEATVAAYDVRSCYLAILASVEIYRDLRAQSPARVNINEQAEQLSVQYLKDVAATVHNLRSDED